VAVEGGESVEMVGPSLLVAVAVLGEV